jgi:hypothetical protein
VAARTDTRLLRCDRQRNAMTTLMNSNVESQTLAGRAAETGTTCEVHAHDRLSVELPRVRSMTWTFLLGDWGRVVRDPLDLLRIGYFIGAIVWLAIGGAAADGLVGASLVLLVVRLVSLPRFYDLSLIVAMTITGWGSALHLYGQWGPYDNIVHFLMPLLCTPIIYVILVRLGILPELRELQQPHHQLGFFLIAFAFGMAIAGGWEALEWTIDQLTGDTRVKDAADTANDLISGVFGSAGAGLTLILWSLRGWHCKRLPARVVEQRLLERRLGARTLEA